MITQAPFATYLLSAVSALIFAAGCGPSSPPAGVAKPTSPTPVAHGDHDDPHDQPITKADVKMPADYADAIVRLKGYRDDIRTNIEAGTPTKAHRSLDEQNIVLKKLPEIARDSGVAKADWETVNLAAKELRDRFDELHEEIDHGQKPDYAAVADKIEAALKKLEGLTPAQKPANP